MGINRQSKPIKPASPMHTRKEILDMERHIPLQLSVQVFAQTATMLVSACVSVMEANDRLCRIIIESTGFTIVEKSLKPYLETTIRLIVGSAVEPLFISHNQGSWLAGMSLKCPLSVSYADEY